MNIFDTSDRNEHGLRSTLKKRSSVDVNKQPNHSWFGFAQNRCEEKKVGFVEEEPPSPDKNPRPYESAEVNMNTFLYKLSCTV